MDGAEKLAMDTQNDFQDRLLRVIPGGAHTYSRGFDQFPSGAPPILDRGEGCHVFDPDGKKYLDYGMGLRSVNIGYAEPRIANAAFEQIKKGNNLTRASVIELQAAELFVDLIGPADMVKFAKNGSTATTAAVKLARAYTKRDLIARCADHPFFSYDDWFIGSTGIPKGCSLDSLTNTKTFKYGDIESLKSLIDQYPNQFACVILEPATNRGPIDACDCDSPQKCEAHSKGNHYLKEVQALCKKHGIVFILDEMITGFRWHLKGAQEFYGIQPDLSTFGKAMANGFSVAAVCGRREIMELGSIESEGTERVFFLSTTHGAEMSGLGAFVETVQMMREEKVVEHLWSFGRRLIDGANSISKEFGLSDYFRFEGYPCSPYYLTFDKQKQISLPLRTLFAQEMLKSSILIPWVALCYRHGSKELDQTLEAIKKSLTVYRQALDVGVEKFLKGPSVKPVFRRFN